MGIIGNLLAGGGVRGVGQAIEGVAGAFRPNANKQLELEHEAFRAALGQFGAEFAKTGPGAFDRFVNALNRLPRPLLAFSTLGLFGFAMADPDAFSRRMVGLERVPEPLWWLLGAIVSFYFGARELHYVRRRMMNLTPDLKRPEDPNPTLEAKPTLKLTPDLEANPALEEWRAEQDR